MRLNRALRTWSSIWQNIPNYSRATFNGKSWHGAPTSAATTYGHPVIQPTVQRHRRHMVTHTPDWRTADGSALDDRLYADVVTHFFADPALPPMQGHRCGCWHVSRLLLSGVSSSLQQLRPAVKNFWCRKKGSICTGFWRLDLPWADKDAREGTVDKFI